MAQVTVNVNVRDLTRGDLQRLRGRFNSLTDGLNEFAGNRSQANLAQLRQGFTDINTEIQQLAGRIPHNEFARLERNARAFQHHMRSAVGPQTNRQLGLMRSRLLDIDRDLNRIGARQAITIPVQVRDDTQRDRNVISTGLRSFGRGLAGLIVGTLSDGIGQGLVGAFRSPIFGSALTVALIGAIMAALSVVGAAISGALVLALGGAFVGLGVMIALQAKGVKERWTKTMNELKPIFADAAKPMIPVIDNAREKFSGVAKEFAPHLKDALEKAAPHLNNFMDATKRGFRKMGENAWDDLQSSFRVFLEAFGPQWEDFLAEFGKSLGALARTVKEHSTEIAMALRAILGIINLLIDVVNFFANAWVVGIHLAINATAALLDAYAILLDTMLGGFDSLLGALEEVASLLGLEGPIKQARENFNALRDHTVGHFRDMASGVRALGTDMDNANRKRKLEVDIESWTAQLNRAKEELKSVPPEKKTELLGRIADLEGKIRSANGQLASMQKDYYVRIHAYKVGDWALGTGFPGRASGGVIGHLGRAATGGARNNMTLVGEQGAEIVNLAPGSRVRSNSDTRRVLNAGMGGEGDGKPIVVQVMLDGRQVARAMVNPLQAEISNRGGDVQQVLGR